MGMSASQARLIALEARMSDTEYEAQQINQQRLVLSNKMNEVTSQAMGMEVPTPPSKQDFLYDAYTGKDRAGKKVTVTVNGDGSLSVVQEKNGTIVTKGDTLDITSGATLKGTEFKMSKKTSDTYHEVQDGEEAEVLLDPNKQITAESFKDLRDDASNYRRYYPDEDGKRKKVTNGQKLEGGVGYGSDPSSTYIRVPKYDYKRDTYAGKYDSNGTYYGDQPLKPAQTKYLLNGEYLTEAELTSKEKEPEKTDENGNVIPAKKYEKKDATEVYAYQTYDPKTRAQGPLTDFMKEPPTVEDKNEKGHQEFSGSYDRIDLKLPITEGSYLTALDEEERKMTEFLSATTATVNGKTVDIDTGSNVKQSIDSQFRITESSGLDNETGFKGDNAFSEDAQYCQGGSTTPSFTGAGIKETSEDHVQRRSSWEIYKKTADGYKKVSWSEVPEEAPAGQYLRKCIHGETSGIGITNKEYNWEELSGKYIVDSEGVAYAVADIGEDEAKLRVLQGQKVITVGDSGTNEYKSAKLGDNVTVAGKEVMTIDEAKAEFGNEQGSTFSNCLSGLEHSYGKYDSEKKQRVFDASAWRVIVTRTANGSATFSFCYAADLADSDGKVQTYVPDQGKFDSDPQEINPNDTERVEYDPDTGHIKKITLEDGTEVALTFVQEVDENAYEDANNKYLYKKAIYDHDQNELNKKTSIYQRQDKMLELKLTRLDTERNALQTEIDAVKKVIQDSIDKGFKTFSG